MRLSLKLWQRVDDYVRFTIKFGQGIGMWCPASHPSHPIQFWMAQIWRDLFPVGLRDLQVLPSQWINVAGERKKKNSSVSSDKENRSDTFQLGVLAVWFGSDS